jgi:hypothetical protein
VDIRCYLIKGQVIEPSLVWSSSSQLWGLRPVGQEINRDHYAGPQLLKHTPKTGSVSDHMAYLVLRQSLRRHIPEVYFDADAGEFEGYAVCWELGRESIYDLAKFRLFIVSN